MIRIRFFSSFCDSENCKSVYERLCETHIKPNYGPDKQIFIVADDSYTHAVIMNTATPNLTVIKDNVIGLAFEPTPFLRPYLSSHFIEYAQKHICKYHIGDASQLPEPFTSQYGFMWHITPPTKTPVKTRPMSIMVSQKHEAPGHLYRHQLVNAILQTDLDIDIYGRGCQFYNQEDKRVKGTFSDDEPYETYQFHICIENFSLPNYTSEKYTNALLWNTTPIYWGAQNPLFPDLTITLSGDVIKDLCLIREIMENPENHVRHFKQDDIRPRLNILDNLDELFSTVS